MPPGVNSRGMWIRGLRLVAAFIFLVFVYLLSGRGLTPAYSLKEERFPQRSNGPIGIRNQMPLYVFYLQMIPDKARVTEHNKLTINADYTVSNITVSGFTPVTSLYKIDIDMEVSRITLDFRYGPYHDLEIGLEVPYISFSRGYLDDFIEGAEDGIGARTPRSRENQGSYEFDYSFRYNGTYLIQRKRSVEGLGDIVFNLKYQLLKEGEGSRFSPNFSARAALKFPTAEKDDLLGSGEWDYGFGLLVDKMFFERVFIYAGANVAVIEKPGIFSMLGVDEQIYSGMLAMEWFFTKRFSFVAQVSGNTTPYPYSNTNALDNDAYELGLGFNYACKGKTDASWHFAITENITAASSPDVSFHIGLSRRF